MRSIDVNQLVNRRRGTGSTEDHFVLVSAIDCLTNNFPGLLTQHRSLGTGEGSFGMSVGVEGQHLVANEILDKTQRAPRGGVIRINQWTRAEGCIDGGVITNDGIADFLDEI